MDRLSLSEVRRVIGEITYKPNVQICVEHDSDYVNDWPSTSGVGFDVATIRIIADVKNVNDGEQIKLYGAHVIVLPITEVDLLKFVFEAVLSFETHELQEWLRRKGKPIREPHAEVKIPIAKLLLPLRVDRR